MNIKKRTNDGIENTSKKRKNDTGENESTDINIGNNSTLPSSNCDNKKLLGQRSREEVLMVACILDACNSLSLDNLERVLNLGNEYNCVDAVFDVFDEIVMFEYDGGYWHNKDNRNTNCVEKDVKKTIERLKKYPDAYMVRLRMFGASPIAEQLRSSDRCILVEPAQKKSITELAVMVCKHLNEKGLLKMEVKNTSDINVSEIKKVVHDLYCSVYEFYKDNYEICIKNNLDADKLPCQLLIHKDGINRILEARKNGWKLCAGLYSAACMKPADWDLFKERIKEAESKEWVLCDGLYSAASSMKPADWDLFKKRIDEAKSKEWMLCGSLYSAACSNHWTTISFRLHLLKCNGFKTFNGSLYSYLKDVTEDDWQIFFKNLLHLKPRCKDSEIVYKIAGSTTLMEKLLHHPKITLASFKSCMIEQQVNNTISIRLHLLKCNGFKTFNGSLYSYLEDVTEDDWQIFFKNLLHLKPRCKDSHIVYKIAGSTTLMEKLLHHPKITRASFKLCMIEQQVNNTISIRLHLLKCNGFKTFNDSLYSYLKDVTEDDWQIFFKNLLHLKPRCKDNEIVYKIAGSTTLMEKLLHHPKITRASFKLWMKEQQVNNTISIRINLLKCNGFKNFNGGLYSYLKDVTEDDWQIFFKNLLHLKPRCKDSKSAYKIAGSTTLMEKLLHHPKITQKSFKLWMKEQQVNN